MPARDDTTTLSGRIVSSIFKASKPSMLCIRAPHRAIVIFWEIHAYPHLIRTDVMIKYLLTVDNEEWQSIPLRCIPFSSNNKTNGSKFVQRGAKTTATNATQQPNPLYINLALMDDENRDQFCFHRVLTTESWAASLPSCSQRFSPPRRRWWPYVSKIEDSVMGKLV